eukprot:7188438-Pyramimonas_sp.AAC.1
MNNCRGSVALRLSSRRGQWGLPLTVLIELRGKRLPLPPEPPLRRPLEGVEGVADVLHPVDQLLARILQPITRARLVLVSAANPHASNQTEHASCPHPISRSFALASSSSALQY